MARIRTIKPEFFTDADLTKLDPLVRLFFVGLWCQADKAGRLKDKPIELKVKCLPFDDIDTEKALELLANARFIIRYVVDGCAYIQVRTWSQHQRPHHTEAESTLPLYNGALTVRERSLRERKGKERKGKERKEKEASGDADLIGWCNWWNGLHEEHLVSGAVRADHPSKGIVAGWQRVQRDSELREILEQRESLRKEVRQSSFCRKPWFRLEKLMGGTNKDGELIAQKLLDGGYRDEVVAKPTDVIPDDPMAEFRKAADQMKAAAVADPLEPMSEAVRKAMS